MYKSDDLQIKGVSLFLPSTRLFSFYCCPFPIFSLLHGLEAAFMSCENKVKYAWVIWRKLLTPFLQIQSYMYSPEILILLPPVSIFLIFLLEYMVVWGESKSLSQWSMFVGRLFTVTRCLYSTKLFNF